MNTWMKKCLLILIYVFMAVFAHGASRDFLFRHYTVDDGLQSNTVRAIIQDKYGFMWFGTDGGLNCYDGSKISQRVFNRTHISLYVSSLMDGGDKIWIGSSKGIYLYDYVTASFKHFNVKTRNHIAVMSDVADITKDKTGNIWITTLGQGVFRYAPRRRQLDNFSFGQVGGIIRQVFVDSENQVWAVSNKGSQSVWRLHKAKDTFVPVRLTGCDMDDYKSLTMAEDSEGNLWLGTWEHGLMKIDKSGHTTNCLSVAMHIHSIMEYAPGVLLVDS